jgi:hypothetical protein
MIENNVLKIDSIKKIQQFVPIHYAVVNNDQRAVKILLENGSRLVVLDLVS